MTRCSMAMMMLAGVVFGTILFLSRKTLSPSKCRSCGILKREFLLSAAIISSFLSYLSFYALSAMGKDDEGKPAQVVSSASSNLQTLEQSKEWQDLKAIWNLVTGNIEFLQDDSDNHITSLSREIPRWKVALLNAAVDHRIKQLDRLVNQGTLSADTSHAIASLFHDMIRHVVRSSSLATCYMMSAEGGRWVHAISEIESQMVEIRKLSKAGTLKEDVLKRIECQLKEKLTVLEILGEWPCGDIKEETVDERIRQWRKQGKINTNWVGGAIRKQIREEIVTERQRNLSSAEVANRREAWRQDQQTVLALAVALGRYEPTRAAEKEIIREFSGAIAQARLLDCFKTADRYEKVSLAEGLGAVGGSAAEPILRELLADKTLECFSRSSPAAGGREDRVYYVAYAICDKAAEALKKLGLCAPDESESTAESPEGRAMVKASLESKDASVLTSAIRAAGHTKDTSLIPRLKSILAADPALRDEIVLALCELGDVSSLPLVISAAEDGGSNPWVICSALEHIGTKEAYDFLQRLILVSNDPSLRMTAIQSLVQKKDKSALQVFKAALKDSQISVRLEAASALQQLDCNDGFPVFVEASKSDDAGLRFEAMQCLEQSKDPRAVEFLATRAQTPDGDGQKQAKLSIIGRGGANALKALDTVLTGSNAEDKQQALFRIGRADADVPGLEAYLINVLAQDDNKMRMAVVTALREKGTTNAIPPLLACLQAHDNDPSASYDVPEAIKAIQQRANDKQLGDFLCDLVGADAVKRHEAEKRKSSLSNADILSLVAAVGDYRKPSPEQEAAKTILNDLGLRCVGPIIQNLSEQPSDRFMPNWKLMEILDAHAEETIQQVMAFMGDPSKPGRANVIAILKGQGPRRKQYQLDKIAGLKELLTQCSTDKDKAVRAAAKSLLIEMNSTGDNSIDTVLAGLTDPSWDVQFQTILSITHNEDKQINPEQKTKVALALVSLLEDKSDKASEYANTKYVLEAMEEFQDKSAIPVLKNMIKAGEPEDKMSRLFRNSSDSYTPVQQAAKLLYALRDGQTVEFLREMTRNDDDIVSLWAHAALYKLCPDKDENLKQIGAIWRETSKRSVRAAGQDIVKSLGDVRCVPILREHLRSNRGSAAKSILPTPRTWRSSDHDEERQNVFKLLVELGGKDVLDDVKSILFEDQDGYLRRDAVDYLVTLAGKDAASLLLQGLTDPSPGVRYHICEVLWVASGSDVVAALRKVADEDPYKDKDEGYEVRVEATETLKKIDLLASGGMQKLLIREAKDTNSNIRGWAIERLGELKDAPAVVTVLEELLKDPVKATCCGRYHIREAAAEALRKHGAKVTDMGGGVLELQ